MTRKKLNLAYITNDRKRNTTFRKRKAGLMKKVDEISTLCGIEACAIVVDPNDHSPPEVWPSRLEGQSVIDRFKRMPEIEQTRKMFDQEAYLREMIMKAREKLEKQREDNKKKQMTYLMHQLLQTGQFIGNVSVDDLNNLSSFIDENLKEVEQRIDWMNAKEVVQNVEAQAMTMSVGVKEENMGHSQGLVIGGRHLASMGHAHGPVSTNDVMQNNQKISMDFINNINGVLPFGDVVPNTVWPNPSSLS